jgi:iron complex outermembrane receptor protein
MNFSRSQRVGELFCATAAALALGATSLVAQDTGFLTGIVVDATLGGPLEGAKVSVPAYGIEVVTSDTGQFLLEEVPLGGLAVKFEADGYVGVVEDLQLLAADFLQVRLDRVEAVLDEILVIAGRRPRPAASSGGDVALTGEEESWRSVMDLIEDQVPGVIVTRGGALGTGATLHIRGSSSFQSDQAPDVYLDGVRISGVNASPRLRMLSRGSSRGLHVLDLLPAESVERVRVLKGVAAVTAFPMAANGVILVETSRGKAPVGR